MYLFIIILDYIAFMFKQLKFKSAIINQRVKIFISVLNYVR